jgi:hypothetical protein
VPLDMLSAAVAFLVTLMILSYLVGDNPAFRVAVHVFVGVAAGYVAAVAWWQVLTPKVVIPLVWGTSTERAALALPALLIGMLLMKVWPPLTRLGMPAMGVLVGAAAAVAIGGAVQGTLIPQTVATVNSFDLQTLAHPDLLAYALLVVLGVVTTLAYFHFGARVGADGTVHRFGPLQILASVGGIFIALTLGVLFAGVYSSALTALIERLHFLAGFLGIG